MTIVHKVLHQDDMGNLRSICAPGKYCQLYPQGKTVYPVVGTYLYAFKIYQDALTFAESSQGDIGSHVIWKAEAHVVDGTPYVAPRLTQQDLDFFWNANTHAQEECGHGAPKGSVWCRSIKLLEQVAA